MTVFKTFLKVLNKCKIPIITYTVALLLFGGFNMQTSENSMNFTAVKPDIYIVNLDQESKLSQNLENYMKEQAHIVSLKDETIIDDALFYRDFSYLITIPSHYEQDFLAGKNPEISVKSTGDYESSLAKLMLERYIKTANVYLGISKDAKTIAKYINDTLKTDATIEMTSSLDTSSIAKTSFFYNFLSYSMMAGAIYVICLILSSFYEEGVRKRTIVSSMNAKYQNKILLLANMGFIFILWLFYVILSIILCGKIMFSKTGLIFMLNSFIFSLVCVTIAFLISNLVHNKNAINGIVNVVALGSSFLCGAFVPTSLLPDAVLNVAHILPTYWYINTNDLLQSIEIFTLESLKPVFINMGVMILFCMIFIIITNVISKKKQQIG